jgi:hypothetical protein
MRGGQLEVAYDVLRFLGANEQQLLPFVRVEFVDLQASVANGFTVDRSQQWKELTIGLSYRPIQQIVLKADAQLLNRVRGLDEVWVNGGLGLMF